LQPYELSVEPRRHSNSSSSGGGQPVLQQLLQHLSHTRLLLAGAASALVSRTAVAPLERIKMEQLLKSSSRSAFDTAMWVYQHEGLLGFWKGNALNVLRTAPFKVGQCCYFYGVQKGQCCAAHKAGTSKGQDRGKANLKAAAGGRVWFRELKVHLLIPYGPLMK
jgi:hypothetical protein